VRAIAKNPKLKERFLDGLIRMFTQNASFDEATMFAGRLLQFEGYTPQELRLILLAVAANDQIHWSFNARRRVRDSIARYGKGVDAAVVKRATHAMA
jgi:hypothetical protein